MSSRHPTNEVFVYAPEYHSFRREDRDWERIRLGTKPTSGKSSTEAMTCPTRGIASSNPSTTVSSPANYTFSSHSGNYGNSSNPATPLPKGTHDYWGSHSSITGMSPASGSVSAASSIIGTGMDYSTHGSHNNYYIGSTQSESGYGDGPTLSAMLSDMDHYRKIRIDDQIHFAFSSINEKKQLHSDLAALYPYFVLMHDESDDDEVEGANTIGGVYEDNDSSTSDTTTSSGITTSNDTGSGPIARNKKRAHMHRLVCPVPSNTELITLYPEYSITIILDMRYSMASTDTEYSYYLDKLSFVLSKILNSLTQNIIFNHRGNIQFRPTIYANVVGLLDIENSCQVISKGTRISTTLGETQISPMFISYLLKQLEALGNKMKWTVTDKRFRKTKQSPETIFNIIHSSAQESNLNGCSSVIFLTNGGLFEKTYFKYDGLLHKFIRDDTSVTVVNLGPKDTPVNSLIGSCPDLDILASIAESTGGTYYEYEEVIEACNVKDFNLVICSPLQRAVIFKRSSFSSIIDKEREALLTFPLNSENIEKITTSLCEENIATSKTYLMKIDLLKYGLDIPYMNTIVSTRSREGFVLSKAEKVNTSHLQARLFFPWSTNIKVIYTATSQIPQSQVGIVATEKPEGADTKKAMIIEIAILAPYYTIQQIYLYLKEGNEIGKPKFHTSDRMVTSLLGFLKSVEETDKRINSLAFLPCEGLSEEYLRTKTLTFKAKQLKFNTYQEKLYFSVRPQNPFHNMTVQEMVPRLTLQGAIQLIHALNTLGVSKTEETETIMSMISQREWPQTPFTMTFICKIQDYERSIHAKSCSVNIQPLLHIEVRWKTPFLFKIVLSYFSVFTWVSHKFTEHLIKRLKLLEQDSVLCLIKSKSLTHNLISYQTKEEEIKTKKLHRVMSPLPLKKVLFYVMPHRRYFWELDKSDSENVEVLRWITHLMSRCRMHEGLIPLSEEFCSFYLSLPILPINGYNMWSSQKEILEKDGEKDPLDGLVCESERYATLQYIAYLTENGVATELWMEPYNGELVISHDKRMYKHDLFNTLAEWFLRNDMYIVNSARTFNKINQIFNATSEQEREGLRSEFMAHSEPTLPGKDNFHSITRITPNLDIMSIIQEKYNSLFYFTGYTYDPAQWKDKAGVADGTGVPLEFQTANSRLHKELAGVLNDLNVSYIPILNKYMPKCYQGAHCYVQPFKNMIIVSFLEGYTPKSTGQKTVFNVKVHASSKFLLDDKARHQRFTLRELSGNLTDLIYISRKTPGWIDPDADFISNYERNLKIKFNSSFVKCLYTSLVDGFTIAERDVTFALKMCEDVLAIEIDVTLLLELTKEYASSNKIEELKEKFNKRFGEIYKRIPGNASSFYFNDTNRPDYDFSESTRNDNKVLENPCFADISLNINGMRKKNLSSLGDLFDCVDNDGWPDVKDPQVILIVSMKSLTQHRHKELHVGSQLQGDKQLQLSSQVPTKSSSPQAQHDDGQMESEQGSIQRSPKGHRRQLSQSPQQDPQNPTFSGFSPVVIKKREDSVKFSKMWGAEKTMKMIGSTIAEETLLELQNKEQITLEVIQAVDQLMNCVDSSISSIQLKLVEPREGRSLFCQELRKNNELIWVSDSKCYLADIGEDGKRIIKHWMIVLIMQQEVIIKGATFSPDKSGFRDDIKRINDLLKSTIKIANQKHLLREMFNTRLCPTPLVERDKGSANIVEDKYSAELERRGFKPSELKCDMIIIKAIQFHDCVIQKSKFKHPAEAVVSIHPDLINYIVKGRTLMFTHKVTGDRSDSYYYIRLFEYISPSVSAATSTPRKGQSIKDEVSYKPPQEYMNLAKIDPTKNYIIVCIYGVDKESFSSNLIETIEGMIEQLTIFNLVHYVTRTHLKYTREFTPDDIDFLKPPNTPPHKLFLVSLPTWTRFTKFYKFFEQHLIKIFKKVFCSDTQLIHPTYPTDAEKGRKQTMCFVESMSLENFEDSSRLGLSRNKAISLILLSLFDTSKGIAEETELPIKELLAEADTKIFENFSTMSLSTDYNNRAEPLSDYNAITRFQAEMIFQELTSGTSKTISSRNLHSRMFIVAKIWTRGRSEDDLNMIQDYIRNETMHTLIDCVTDTFISTVPKEDINVWMRYHRNLIELMKNMPGKELADFRKKFKIRNTPQQATHQMQKEPYKGLMVIWTGELYSQKVPSWALRYLSIKIYKAISKGPKSPDNTIKIFVTKDKGSTYEEVDPNAKDTTTIYQGMRNRQNTYYIIIPTGNFESSTSDFYYKGKLMDGGIAATGPCPRRMHYTIVVKPEGVKYSFYNTNKYKIKDFNDMFSRKFINFGKRVQMFNEYMFQKLGLFQGISPEHTTIGAVFSEIKTLSIQQKRMKEHKTLTEEASALAKTPFLLLKTVGPIESIYLNDMKLTQNPMKDGLHSMLRFATVHSRDTSASAFCRMLLEKDITDRTLFDYDVVTKAITEMRFVHWCRVPWIIGADGNKSSRIDMQALDIENILVFDAKTMEHMMKTTPEETTRWQNVSREMFLTEYKTYIRQCVSLTSINTVTKLRASRRNSSTQDKQQMQLASSQRQTQVIPPGKFSKSARQLTMPTAAGPMQGEPSQAIQAPPAEPLDSKGICEFFFKKSDNSVILFKISFTDGYLCGDVYSFQGALYQTNLGRMETEGEKAFKFAEAINKTIAHIHLKSSFYDYAARALMEFLEAQCGEGRGAITKKERPEMIMSPRSFIWTLLRISTYPEEDNSSPFVKITHQKIQPEFARCRIVSCIYPLNDNKPAFEFLCSHAEQFDSFHSGQGVLSPSLIISVSSESIEEIYDSLSLSYNLDEEVGKCTYKVIILLLKNPFKEEEVKLGFYLIRVSEDHFPIKAVISDRDQERKFLLGIIDWARARFTNAIIACKKSLSINETWSKLRKSTGLFSVSITPREFSHNIVDTCFGRDVCELDMSGLCELPVVVPPTSIFDSALPWGEIIEHIAVYMGDGAKTFRTSDATHFVLFSETDEDLLLHIEYTDSKSGVGAYLRRRNDDPVPVYTKKPPTEAERELVTRFVRVVTGYLLTSITPW